MVDSKQVEIDSNWSRKSGSKVTGYINGCTILDSEHCIRPGRTFDPKQVDERRYTLTRFAKEIDIVFLEVAIDQLSNYTYELQTRWHLIFFRRCHATDCSAWTFGSMDFCEEELDSSGQKVILERSINSRTNGRWWHQRAGCWFPALSILPSTASFSIEITVSVACLLSDLNVGHAPKFRTVWWDRDASPSIEKPLNEPNWRGKGRRNEAGIA